MELIKAAIPISIDDSFEASVPDISPDHGTSDDQSRSTSAIDICDTDSSFVIAPTPEGGLRYPRSGNRQNQASRRNTEALQPANEKALPPLPGRATERGATGACVDTSLPKGLRTTKPTTRTSTAEERRESISAPKPLEPISRTARPRTRASTAKERQGGISSPKPPEPVSRVDKPRTRAFNAKKRYGGSSHLERSKPASRTAINTKSRTRVSKKKRCDSSAIEPASGVAVDGEYEIYRIVDHRSTADGDEYEVVWKNTWVSAEDLRGARETLRNFKAERFGNTSKDLIVSGEFFIQCCSLK